MNETIEKDIQEVRVKPYELRELCADDMFPMLTILRKIGIREFKECFSKETIEAFVEAFTNGAKAEEGETSQDNAFAIAGISILPSVLDVVDVLLANIPKCDKDLYKFLASISNLEVEEIKKLRMADFVGMIIDVIKKEEFKDFFKVVSESFR